MFFMFASSADQHAGRPGAGPHRVQLPFSIYLMRNSFEAVPQGARGGGGHRRLLSWQVLLRIFMPAVRPAIVTVIAVCLHHLVERVSRRPGHHEPRGHLHAPARCSPTRAQETSIGGTDWGMLQAGVTISIIPCVALLSAPAEVLRLRLPQRRGEIRGRASDGQKAATADRPTTRRRPPSRPPARPTIRDVARLAGVSVGTASKALNNNGSLRQETRDRVIARRPRARLPPQRPRPEPASRPEPHRRPDLDRQLRPFHHADHGGARGVPDRPPHGGLHVQRHRRPRARGAARRIAARQARRRHRRDRAPRRPAAQAASAGPRRAGHLRLHPGRRPGCLLPAARRRGRRGAGHPAPDRSRPPAHRPYHRARAVRGGAPAPRRLSQDACRRRAWRRRRASICPASGRKAGAARLSPSSSAAASRPPDAIFCGNDQIARGAADALRERGIVVPDGVSIVGFDNWEIMAEATRPPLTSVDMNLKDLGRHAGLSLLDQIAGKQLARRRTAALHAGRARLLRRQRQAARRRSKQTDRGERKCASIHRSGLTRSGSRAPSGASVSIRC